MTFLKDDTPLGNDNRVTKYFCVSVIIAKTEMALDVLFTLLFFSKVPEFPCLGIFRGAYAAV